MHNFYCCLKIQKNTLDHKNSTPNFLSQGLRCCSLYSILLEFHAIVICPIAMRPGYLQSCPALPGGRHRRNALRQILRKLPVCMRR